MWRGMIGETWQLVRRDAARWVRPEQVAELDEVSVRVLLGLLVRHPPFRAVTWFRFASLLKQLGVRGVPGVVQRRMLRVYGVELSPGMPVDGGLYIAHPVGCVLHAESIGANVSVIAGVTFGARGEYRWPTIGDGAFIGAGARIIGGVHVGADSTVGANAVVLSDVPAGATAVGVPARMLERTVG